MAEFITHQDTPHAHVYAVNNTLIAIIWFPWKVPYNGERERERENLMNGTCEIIGHAQCFNVW